MALEIKTIDRRLYYDFCCDEKRVFISSAWIDIYDKKIVFCGIFDDAQLMAVFYYYNDTFSGIPYYHCPPFTPYNGYFTKIGSKNFASQSGENKRLISCIANYFDKLSFKSIVRIAFPPEQVDMQPFVWNKFKVIPNYTYRISLAQSTEEISAKMTAERRNDIKKATKDGLITELCNDNTVVKTIIEKTFNRKSLQVDGEFLNKIFFQYANSENSFAFVSYQNNKPMASVFCIYDNTTAYYLLGGYDSTNKHPGAGALALWSAIEHSKKIGLQKFDFEGSMIKPIEKYFRGFGGDLTPYFIVNKANFVLEILLKFFKRELF